MPIGEFVELQRAILNIDADAVARTPDLGKALSFSDAAEIVRRTQELLNPVGRDKLYLVPEELLDTLHSSLQDFIIVLQQISRFTVTREKAAERKSELESNIKAIYSDLFSRLAPIVSLLQNVDAQGSRADIISEFEEKFNKQIDEVLTKARAASEVADGASKSLEVLLEETRTKAAEITTTKEAAYFATTSESYGKRAGLWLVGISIGVITLVVLSSIFLYATISGTYATFSSTLLAQIAVSKFVLLGVVAYATNLCARNYFASRHNEVVNHHRQNAILSYRALVEATGKPEHRDVILSYAASAVFAPQETAFVKVGTLGVDLPSTAVNVFGKAPE